MLVDESVRDGEADGLLCGLRSRERGVGIWGCGAIGSSAAYYLGQVGLRCVGYDILEERVEEIRQGHFQSTSAQGGSRGTRIGPLHVTGTTRWQDLESSNIGVHLVCVPTERAAEPSSATLEDVVPRIARVVRATPTDTLPPLVSIESTILPGWLDDIVMPALLSEGLRPGVDVLVGTAPRRDWFNGQEYTIENLPRIVGGIDERTTCLLVAFYSLICATVQPAIDARHAAFTKVIENVIRYQGITLGNTLALAFPDFDMRHILRLASTKWNIPAYYPSLGIGGHCIPLAPQYVLEEGGAGNPYLGAVRDAIVFNESYFRELVGRRLATLLQGKRSVGVLGMAYTPDAKMHKLSPAFAVLDALRQTPRLRLHDPYYSPVEIEDLCGVPSMHFPRDVSECDAIVLVTGHSAYRDARIEEFVTEGTVIIDNTGIWRHREFADGVRYYEVGRIPDKPVPDDEPYSPRAD